MSRGKLFSGLTFLAISLLWASTGKAEIGYINILNGIEPAKAFVVERQGAVITPESVYTNLEEGDVVKPSEEVLLLFTPVDTACEAVEIQGAFTATACPPPVGGLKEAAYDFVSNEFLAAPSETVGVYATRGAKEKRVHSLPPQALKVFAESPDVAASLKKTPFVALTADQAEAQALVLGQDAVQLLSPGQTKGPSFKLPAEVTAFRQALLRRINFQTMSQLASPGPWPAIEWSINIHTPKADGPVDYEGQKWSPVKTVTSKDSPSGSLAVTSPCLLTFKIVNQGDKPYYAYLVNYTEEGQILPFLPPQEQPQRPNLAAAGAELSLAGIFLELGEGHEFVRLIISENPLDLRPFSQEGLDDPAAAAAAARLRPAPANSWATIVQAFEVK